MCDSPDIMFSQYGQGFPTPSLSWHIPEQHRPEPTIKKSRTRREGLKRKASVEHSLCQSYVLNNEKKKGLRLIQIQVLDISERQENEINTSENEDVVVLSAQYVVSEPVDYVMEETQSLINKISKKLCGDDCY